MSFKVGDKVKIIRAKYSDSAKALLGQIGTITKVDAHIARGTKGDPCYGFINLDIENPVHGIWFDEIELVSANTHVSGFKVGDQVKSSGNYTGSTYTVTETDKDDTITIRTNKDPLNTLWKMVKSDWHLLSKIGQSINQDIDKATCSHEWKVYRGFSFDDEYCPRCKTTRPLSEDAA